MKTATVRELRNNYTMLLRLVQTGEEIVITQRGKRVARLVPDDEEKPQKVNWTKSAALTRKITGERMLTAEESAYILKEASGKW